MERKKIRAVVEGAVIAALYTTLCVALAPISFGQMQIRVAEALTLLPLFTPNGIWGVTVGCILSNTFGLFLGTNILGPWDILFGSLATLIAACLTRILKKPTTKGFPILAPLPPVVLNAVVVGLELTFVTVNHFDIRVFLIQAVYVAVGEIVACYGLGWLLFWAMERRGLKSKIFLNQYS